MPLKQVDNYSSKMTYAINWRNPYLKFNEAAAYYYYSLSYDAVGARTVKGELEITCGQLWGVSIYEEKSISQDGLKDRFIKDYDSRYGIRWEAKLSGVDNIKLSGGESSFAKIKEYYDTLTVLRRDILHTGELQTFFHVYEGWYINA